MYSDRVLAARQRARTAREHGIDILLDAWAGTPKHRRAAMIAAQGDLPRAAAYAGGGWADILNGKPGEALAAARKAIRVPGMAFLEAEALFAAGAVTNGLKQLETLHQRGDAPATVALARRRHQLGDHLGAIQVARALPQHAHAALTGARAALIANQPQIAYRFVEPFLYGTAPLPEPATAGAAAVAIASVLAKLGEHPQLKRFVTRLIDTADLPEDMMPTVARAAWMGGQARPAWDRFGIVKSPWCTAARLELAVLAGDAAMATGLIGKAGPLGGVSAPAVRLLQGEPQPMEPPADGPHLTQLTEEARHVFAADNTVHIWRTHPHRWQPWIAAALGTQAEIVVCDLATGDLPDPDVLATAVMDDGALVEQLAPVPVAPVRRTGSGVWIGRELCRGIGVGHDWPEQETETVRRELGRLQTDVAELSAVRLVGADHALAAVGDGHPLVVVAPPGDPFWNGPWPERVWPAVRVVRTHPATGWKGAGIRAAAAAKALLGVPGAVPGAAPRQDTRTTT